MWLSWEKICCQWRRKKQWNAGNGPAQASGYLWSLGTGGSVQVHTNLWSQHNTHISLLFKFDCIGEVMKQTSISALNSPPELLLLLVIIKTVQRVKLLNWPGVINARATALKDSITTWQCAFWDCRLTGGIEPGAASARFSLCVSLAVSNYQQRSMTEIVTLVRTISSAAPWIFMRRSGERVRSEAALEL